MKNIKKNVKVSKTPLFSRIILVVLGLMMMATFLFSFYGCGTDTKASNEQALKIEISDLERRIENNSQYFDVVTMRYEENPKLTKVNIKNISKYTFKEVSLTVAFLDENRNVLFTERTDVYSHLSGNGDNVNIYTQNFDDMYESGVIKTRVKYVYVIDVKENYFADFNT